MIMRCRGEVRLRDRPGDGRRRKSEAVLPAKVGLKKNSALIFYKLVDENMSCV